MRKTMLLAMSMLITVGLVVPGCSPEPEPAPPDDTPLDVQQAFYVALNWLQTEYPDRAPEVDASWVFEDVTVLGPDGEPLLGAAEKRVTSADWVADITWAVVGPEFLQYQITLKSPELGWFWQGAVKALGGQVYEDVALQQMTAELAEEVAWLFVKSSPTYRRSGIADTLDLVGAMPAGAPFGWTFVLQFDSRHSGYGDEEWQVVLPVVTPHRAVVTVQAMVVTEAIMDGRWDMLVQESLALDEDGARQVAEDFVQHSPTYAFDGRPETFQFVSSEAREPGVSWTFVFRFESRQAGYGDRTGQMLAQVITPHEAVVVVADGVVQSAVLDGRWNMLTQELIGVTEERAREIAADFVVASPTFAFDGILATLELAETLYPDVENAFTLVYRFESAHAGYGDRTGQMLAEAITPHEAHVTVQDGVVSSALMDGKWDMLAQEMVQ